ncbi:MAG: hypothetical protein ACREBW_02810 [Candidatus Micrarchaeaceae archaeon]
MVVAPGHGKPLSGPNVAELHVLCIHQMRPQARASSTSTSGIQ